MMSGREMSGREMSDHETREHEKKTREPWLEWEHAWTSQRGVVSGRRTAERAVTACSPT